MAYRPDSPVAMRGAGISGLKSFFVSYLQVHKTPDLPNFMTNSPTGRGEGPSRTRIGNQRQDGDQPRAVDG